MPVIVEGVSSPFRSYANSPCDTCHVRVRRINPAIDYCDFHAAPCLSAEWHLHIHNLVAARSSEKKDVNEPSRASNSEGRPLSTTLPPSITMAQSAICTSE